MGNSADNYDGHSDLELITAARDKGDYLAFEEFLSRHSHSIHATLYAAYNLSHADCSDVWQVTCITLLRRLPDFDAKRGTPRKFLFLIAGGCAVDHYRRVARERMCWRRYSHIVESILEPAPYAVHEQSADAYQDIETAIGTLTNSRHVKCIRFLCEGHKTYEEIAGHFACSIGAARQLVFRARKEFRSAWEALQERKNSQP